MPRGKEWIYTKNKLGMMRSWAGMGFIRMARLLRDCWLVMQGRLGQRVWTVCAAKSVRGGIRARWVGCCCQEILGLGWGGIVGWGLEREPWERVGGTRLHGGSTPEESG